MATKEHDPEGFRRYYPVRNENKVNNKYDFFISMDESIIYKKNNQSSQQFNALISNEETLNRFKKVLDGSIFEPVLQQHIPNGFELETDGSYKSKFMHGFRLDMIHTYEIIEEVSQMILEQCELLIQNLALIDSQNDLFGDWALHNLVFSLEYQCIMNVDLEGFLTYDPLPNWADFKVVETWLNQFKNNLFKCES